VDDGFNKANMKKIMDAANKRNVKMSFLPIGSMIAANPGLYREIIDSGHEIYNHT
jgi:peptidoglycan/xylan/chitin deacetylase (PgdA/CDA1 family)